MESIPIGVVASLLGYQDAGELTKALKDGENDRTPEEIQSILGDRFKTIISGANMEGYKRAERTVLDEREKSLRAKFEIPKDVTGDFQELVAYAVDQAKNVEVDATPEDIRKSDIYKTDISKYTTQLQDLQGSLQKTQGESRRKFALLALAQSLPDVLAKHGYEVPEGATIRRNLFGTLLSLMEANGVEIREGNDGKLFPYHLETQDVLKNPENGYQAVGLDTYALKYAGDVFSKSGGKNDGPKPPKGGEDGGGQDGDFPETRTREQFQVNLQKMRTDGTKPEVREAYMKHVKQLESDGAITE